MPVTLGTRLGPYEILAPIGAGGMGEVYRARDTRLDRTVAIKVLPAGVASDPERRRRFEQEARAVAALSHPHICVLYDIGDVIPTGPQTLAPGPSSVSFLVMEYLEGETLATRLRRGPLPLSEALAAGAQMADALGAAHRRGIVHRDLKPGNVMLTPTGVKLLDFGLAKLKPAATDVLASRSALTTGAPEETSGALVGTVPYMAPEQLEGKAVDARTDVFALGCVLYEMLTGRRAFEGASAASVMTAILTSEPAAVSALQPVTPPLVDRLVRTCLAKDPAKRWDSAHDVAEQLRAISDTSASRAAPLAPSAATGTGWRWTRRWIALASAAVLVVVAAVVVFAPRILRPTQPAPVASTTPSVLALPCKVFGAPEVAFLTDAVPQTMSTLLARIDGLDTKVPPSSLEVEKVDGDLTRLAALYGVSSFIVTSITASPTRYALNVQLVDAATRNVRWGHQYEGSRESYNDLVRQAADGIRLEVTPNTSLVPTAGVSSEAELAFREGMYFHLRYRAFAQQPDFEAALAAYTRALALEPTFASAAGRVAGLYNRRFDAEGDVHQARRDAESWARRALGMDPRCGEAWAALSLVELSAPHADPKKGIDYAVKGVAFAPRDSFAHGTFGMWVGGPGSYRLFAAAMLRAFELDPLAAGYAASGAMGLCLLGRPQEALSIIDRAVRAQPGSSWPSTARAFVLLSLGRLDDAEHALRSSERDATATHTFGALWRQIRFALAVAQQDTATSQTLAREVVASALDTRADANLVSNASMFAVAPLARIGRTDDAVRILLRSVEAGVAPPYEWLLRDPDIQRLRGDPRFGKVLAASHDGAEMVARVLGEARARGELPAYLHQPLDELVQLLKENEQKH